MQTSTTITKPAIAPDLAGLPKAKRTASDPFRRDPLACQIMDAIAHLLDVEPECELLPGRYEIDVYLALLPVCRDYTVADAHRAFVSVYPLTKALDYRGTDRDRSARYLAGGVLQSFISIARPSSPEDVSALAEHLTFYNPFSKYDPVMAQVRQPTAAITLANGIDDLRRGDFSRGQLFGSAGDGNDPEGWCYRAARAQGRMKWWYPPKMRKARG